MMSNPSNTKQIAKNTLMLYFRQLLILIVSLYSVRIVLEVLGVEDYGIYNVIAGIVSFFSFLSGTMASASQRYFSFAIGQKDTDKLKTTFTVNWIIYAAISIIAFILLESIGLWFINNKLNIPAESLDSALVIYRFSIMTFIATILTTPFMAVIIAHEDMQIYAYVSILEAVLKLVIIFLLNSISWNKLELYGLLVFLVSIINCLTYIILCLRRYEECQFRKFYWNRVLLNEIIGFTSWTLLGQITTVMRNQAITILLNQVFNPIVVAARAIAMNISTQVGVFSNNFNVGLYPPIIKSYASNDNVTLFSLIYNGSKITFFLMWIISFPMFLEMDFILNLWLKNPPEGAVLFSRLSLIEVLINSLCLPLATAARAPGRMKEYELILGSIQIVIFICSWGVLIQGAPAYSVFVVAIVANIIMIFVRLLVVGKLIGISFVGFLKEVLLPVLLMLILSIISIIPIYYYLPSNFVMILSKVCCSIIISSLIMFYVGLSKNEQVIIKHLIYKITAKINYTRKI